ncbi:MAG: HK97 family phage prohead protease [Clostridiales bacterium]|nr:HK97 family phage prohead protease [Clostridiales bacterium]MBQ1572773.1 HK97 family phage prohead protease [Clostridiales bacterium]
MNKELERRNYQFEVRAEEREDGIKILTGRPIVYNSPTDIGGYFQEVIERGALDETDLTDVRFLVNHNTDMIPLARSRRNNGNSTMQMRVDTEGLFLEKVELDVEANADAKALYSAISRGDVSGMSMMFSVAEDVWDYTDPDYPIRKITKIGSVVEVSAVTWPAYDSTFIDARSNEALESAKATLERAKEQREQSVDTDSLNLAKAKFKLI